MLDEQTLYFLAKNKFFIKWRHSKLIGQFKTHFRDIDNKFPIIKGAKTNLRCLTNNLDIFLLDHEEVYVTCFKKIYDI